MIALEDAGLVVETPRDGRMVQRVILHPLSTHLSEQRIALIGANGSGKSTLLRLLNGLVVPTSGRVLVNGADTRKDARRVRRQVGFVFTDPLHQLVMPTPLDDVQLSLRGSLRGRRDRSEQARALLEQRGLGAVAESSIYDLSGGERQLVSLTTVLAVEPAIVVADEPTTLLDLRNRTEVVQALLALDQQLVVATHDLELAARCDRALVVDQGSIVFDGPADAAVTHYRQMMARP